MTSCLLANFLLPFLALFVYFFLCISFFFFLGRLSCAPLYRLSQPQHQPQPEATSFHFILVQSSPNSSMRNWNQFSCCPALGAVSSSFQNKKKEKQEKKNLLLLFFFAFDYVSFRFVCFLTFPFPLSPSPTLLLSCSLANSRIEFCFVFRKFFARILCAFVTKKEKKKKSKTKTKNPNTFFS